MKAIKNIGTWFQRVYDKLLAVAVFAALAASVTLLFLRVGSIQKLDREYESDLNGLMPRYPDAVEATADSFDSAMARLENPPQIAAWTNDLTVPGRRVWCIHCRRPIGFEAEICPFCDGKQPDLEDIGGIDSDGDGMPDLFETTHKLDPKDPTDGKSDADGDLFTNYDEWRHKTDVNDPNDYPPIEAFLSVSKIAAIPFDLLFKSHMRGAGDSRTFAVNTRDGGRTYFVKIGDSVEGFEVWRFEQKAEADASTSSTKDVSVLTLRKGSLEIPLVMGAGIRYEDFTVELTFRLERRTITCKLGDEFELRKGRNYRVMEVDNEQKNVVIRRLSDGKNFTVGTVGGEIGG